MKTAIIFADGIKQIMFTAENEQEKMALEYLSPDDTIDLAIVSGSIYSANRTNKPYSGNINLCQGGYLRIFDGEDSVMLVLRPKKKESTPMPTDEMIAKMANDYIDKLGEKIQNRIEINCAYQTGSRDIKSLIITKPA